MDFAAHQRRRNDAKNLMKIIVVGTIRRPKFIILSANLSAVLTTMG